MRGAALALMPIAFLLAGCQGVPLDGPAERGKVTLQFTCTTAPAVPSASYVGAYAGVESAVTATDAARDVHCADEFKSRKYPHGFVTIIGSSRISQNNRACDATGQCDATLQQNDRIYAAVREFAAAWTTRHGKRHPIMAGAGPGLMLAAAEGARAAGGPSIGYTTYYDRPDPPAAATPARPYGGDPAKAFNPHVTDGLIFTSIAQREAAMVRHSAAMVVAPGGTGTEWEIFQTIELLKSRQQLPAPVYFLGDRDTYWKSLDARLRDLVARRVVRQDELDPYLRFVASPAELVERLSKDLGLP